MNAIERALRAKINELMGKVAPCFIVDWGSNDIDGTEKFTVDTPKIEEILHAELLPLFNAGIVGAYAAAAKRLDALADVQDALSENLSKRGQIAEAQECAEICEHLREAAISIRALTPADARQAQEQIVKQAVESAAITVQARERIFEDTGRDRNGHE